MKRTCKTILAYVLSAVLMATLGCTSLNGAAFAEADLLNQVYEISSVTMTTTVVPSPEQEATTSITTMEYDERGLVTSVIASDGTREIRTPVSWTFDEQGTPKSCFMEFAGQRVKVTIENRYENNVLREAIISDMIVDGASLANSGALKKPEKMESNTLSFLLQAMKMVQDFVGYRNCTLRVLDTDVQIRYEDGRLVYSYSVLPEIGQEQFTEHMEDGSVWTALNTYQLSDDGRSLVSCIATLTDAELYLKELSVSTGPDEKVTFLLNCSDPMTETNTGETVRMSFVEDLRFNFSDVSEEEKTGLKEMLKEIPVMMYALDGEGRVIRSGYAPAFSELLGGTGLSNTTLTWYNAAGKTVRIENSVQSATYSSTTVTEYTYR